MLTFGSEVVVERGREEEMAAVACDEAATAATREESKLRLDKSSPVFTMEVPMDALALLPIVDTTDKPLLLTLQTILPPCSLDVVDPLEELIFPKETSDFEDTAFFVLPLAPLLCMVFPEVVWELIPDVR